MPNYIFGDVAGVNEGDHFDDRASLRAKGVHLAPVAGIDGNGAVGSSSIVLNGGYVDDFDKGDIILYTGHGGNDSGSKKQVKDQSWDAPGNKALLTSEMRGLPVRVTRGFNHTSPLSPKKGYQYGGLYMVTDHFEEIGKDGYKICRYQLEKINKTTLELTHSKETIFSEGSDGSKRVDTTTSRIVRDTKLSRQIKEEYSYVCQMCGIIIETHGARYAEGAHIKPLGKPHNGTDTPDNLLCLCPNHHVMLDKGIIAINDDLTLIGIQGKIMISKGHEISLDNICYHRSHIYI
ncbi:HNH endonuclease [Candidatus Gracilibacteria bacterium]|nr:HNH endonuclease [Candidatus Gracilibacteria bacterium]